MNQKTYLQIAFYTSIVGVLFSGYYSSVRFFSETCPFNESCPIVWGQPACYFGFFLFILSLISASLALFLDRKMLPALIVDGFLGVIFTGYLTYQDIFYPSCIGGNCHYDLLLPTCAYGFIFFVIILVSAIFAQIKSNEKTY